MKKTILLISNHFPFSPGEEFLEVEIDILSRYFDVIVAPMSTKGKRRDVPSNVEIDESLAIRIDGLSKSKTLRMWKGLAKFKKEALKELLKKPFSLGKISETINYLAIASEINDWFENRYIREKINVDILYSYWLLYASYAISKIKEKHSGIICISRAHGTDLYDYASNRYHPFREYIFSKIDRVFCISNHGREYLSTLFPEYANKITVSRLGTLDLKHLNEGSKDGKIRIVSCSSLKPIKRVELIINAVSYASEKINKEIIWTHIGDGPERKKLEALAHSKLKRNNIMYEFLGYLPHNDVLNYYLSNPVDVFINTSSSEGLPVSIMEAMSFGIPVIATNVGGTSEIVDNDNGFILNKDVSSEEIGEILIRLINEDQNKIAIRRKNARKKWKSFLNAKRNFKEFAMELMEIQSRGGKL